MNERIRLLAEQAGFKVNWQHEDVQAIKMARFEKFAELIVQECVDIGDNYQEILGNEPECFNCRKVAYGIVDKIKQHFGVEL
jgi:hypothetical protein